MVSEPVSEKFGTEKSPGTGLENIWYQKKSRNRSRKILVPKKSLGIGIVPILGLVTHCLKYSVHLEGVLRSGLDPLGNGGNRTDPCEHVLQIGGCIQNLVVSSHSMDKIHKLLEVEL